MKDTRTTLDRILKNGESLIRDNVRSVLILYEQDFFYIGDACFMFDNIRPCKFFFGNAIVTINFNRRDSAIDRCKALLENNPYLDGISVLDWEEIDFPMYDVVLCAIPEEEKLLNFIDEKYDEALAGGQMDTCVFSVSENFIYPIYRSALVFPKCNALMEYSKEFPGGIQHEIYIVKEEREWANNWLLAKGIKKDEHLFIVFDSASLREKLLRIDTYFIVLTAILSRVKARVLIFCEKGIDKVEFYRECLDDNLVSKILFTERQGLRKDIALLSSDYVKMIFGPCTGMLHCASGIYNNLTRNGLPLKEVPLMVTYTGKYPNKVENAWFWWGNSPLMNCLLLKNISGTPKMYLLNELDLDERINTDNVLDCKEYTPEMIVDFMNEKLRSVYN